MRREHLNLVDLVGEVIELPVEVTLPSGEEIVEFRISVSPEGGSKS